MSYHSHHRESRSNPFLRSLFAQPPEAEILPALNYTKDGWVLGNQHTENNTFFNTQMVECVYPYSGNYQGTARGIYYCLILISIFVRKIDWLSTVAAGLVMTYSSTAAVHAVVLAIFRKRLISRIAFDNNWEIVSAQGSRWKPQVDWNSTADVWVPVVPSVWDSDSDATIAIVCTATFAFIPMQIWSRTFRDRKYRPLVMAWGLILLIGSFSAIFNEAYVVRWDFPQYRFCPIGHNDTLPITSIGPDPYTTPWVIGDWYRWNRIVGDHFVFNNSTFEFPTACLYPCFGQTWPLRSSSNILVRPMNMANTMAWGTASLWILASFCVILMFFGLFGVLLVIITSFSASAQRYVSSNRRCASKLAKLWNDSQTSKLQRFGKMMSIILLMSVAGFVLVLSGPFTILFVVYWEWVMWSGPVSDEFKDVGQWGYIVSTGLPLTTAVVSFVILKCRGRTSEEQHQSPGDQIQVLYYELSSIDPNETTSEGDV